MKTLSYSPPHNDTTGWKRRHKAAVLAASMPSNSVTHERSIVQALNAWIEYASAHKRRFESAIGEDYVLGPAWARWGFALRDLLNGETGDLDCGTLDKIICANLAEMGFDPNQGAP